MHGYNPTVLPKFQHKTPSHHQYTSHSWDKSIYRKYIQLDTQQSSAPNTNSIDTNRVQSISGTFLYYDRSLDPYTLPALNKISTCQSTPNQDIMDKCNQVMDYASTHPNATIQYHASDMILPMTHTYAAYLVLPTYRSRIAGHYYFTNHMLDHSKGNPNPNEPI